MVRDHVQGSRVIICPRDLANCLEQFLKQVNIIITVHAPHHGRNSFQAHSGIHRRAGQFSQFALCITVVLHEHQVPDFNITVTILIG